MKFIFTLAFLSLWSVAARGGEIEGKVVNAQGAAVAGATVTVSTDHQAPRPKVTTAADGTYHIEDLTPGAYTVTVSTANGLQTLRREVSVGSGSEPARADFQLRPAAAVATADVEYNPNIFVFRIDQNELRNRLQTARGPDPQYTPDFLAEQNFFGAEYGAPIMKFDPMRPRPLAGDWRGSAVGFIQNSALNARNFFNVGPLLASRSSSYGLTGSGPVLTRKASLLLQFGQSFTSGMVNGNVQEPQATERTPLATDPRAAAIVAALLKAYPAHLPNLPSVSPRQLNSSAPRDVKALDAQARLDLKPTDSASYAFRYSINNYNEDPFQIVFGQNPRTDLRAQTAYTSVTKAFSPKTTGQFGFYFDRMALLLTRTREYSQLLVPVGYSSVPEIQFSSSPTTYSELFNIGPGTQFPRRRIENQFRSYSDLSRIIGRHTVKVGWSTARIRVNDLQSDNAEGTLAFGTDFGRTATQNFLLGTASSFTHSIGNLYRGFRSWEHDLFLQDQFRLSPTLTMSLGVRYELMTVPQEVNHLNGGGFPADHNNIAPRFGFAWNPRRGSTVVRGSYGISYGTIPPATYGFTRFNGPGIQVISQSAPDLLTALNGGYQTTNRSARYLLSPDLVFPYSHQYSFSIERALSGTTRLRAAYVGSRTFHLLTQDAYNRAEPVPGIPLTTATVNQRRPDQRYFGIYEITSNSIAYYDAAQVSLDQRIFHGLTFRASYTWGKAIDTGGDFTNNATNGQNIGEVGMPSCEKCDYVSDHKAVSLFDTPHAATFGYSYNLPAVLEGGGWGAALLKGWQISGTTIFQSGTPFHIHTGSDGPGFGNVDGEGQDRPNILNPSILHKSVDNPDTSTIIMNPAYFNTNLPPGGRGNLGMNAFRKKGANNTNFAVGRTFRLPGDQPRSLQFRSEFINLFNRAQFDKGGNLFSSIATFGKITNTVNKGRQVQFTLRLNF